MLAWLVFSACCLFLPGGMPAWLHRLLTGKYEKMSEPAKIYRQTFWYTASFASKTTPSGELLITPINIFDLDLILIFWGDDYWCGGLCPSMFGKRNVMLTPDLICQVTQVPHCYTLGFSENCQFNIDLWLCWWFIVHYNNCRHNRLVLQTVKHF